MSAGPRPDPYDHTPTPAAAFARARRRFERDRLRSADLDRRGDTPAPRRSTKTGSPGTLRGLAIVHDSPAIIHEGGTQIWEVVRPKSLRLPTRRDVLSALNHSSDHLIGRTANGSLVLEETPEGVRFTTRLPDTSVGHDVAVMARDGLLRGCSFQFTIPAGGQSFRRAPDGKLLRTITAYTLYELGPVVTPAYPTTTLEAGDRSADEDALGRRVAFTLAWGGARAVDPPISMRERVEQRSFAVVDVELT